LRIFRSIRSYAPADRAVKFRQASYGGQDVRISTDFGLTRHIEFLLTLTTTKFGSKAPSQWWRKFCGGGTTKASLASGELPYVLLDAMAHNMVTFFSRIILAGFKDYLNRIFAIIPLSS
jgi:hypothetical protein